MRRLTRRIVTIVAILLVPYLLVVAVYFLRQRSMLYFPTHSIPSTSLTPWRDGNRIIGYCREVSNPRCIWLMAHGNGGQAADRDYVLGRMSDQDSLYVLEYPGYGSREGSPGREAFNQAAAEAYRFLRSQNPDIPVCALGESIGSGPACSLAQEETPPNKIVLVVPFDSLANVAAKRVPLLPARLMLLDDWDNVEALQHYPGPVEIFGATDDTIIPVEHARALAEQVPGARFTAISGGHNDWSWNEQVKIRP